MNDLQFALRRRCILVLGRSILGSSTVVLALLLFGTFTKQLKARGHLGNGTIRAGSARSAVCLERRTGTKLYLWFAVIIR